MSTVGKIPPITMSKLYVGNLPKDITENAIRQLFFEQNLACTNILVKQGGYAFVDCPDQSSADRAIDRLNSFNFNETNLIVEPSVASAKKRGLSGFIETLPLLVGNGWIQTSRVIISNLASHIRFEDIESLLTQYGRIISIDKLPSTDLTTQAVAIIYENTEQAQQSVNNLNGVEVEGRVIKVELSVEKRSRKGSRTSIPSYNLSAQNRQSDFPLRILVQSEMVGAIIGRQGSTIRQITQQTRARVDVHRKDNIGSLEKAITIYGNAENCSNACHKILKVMEQEVSLTSKGEVNLKILAHNNLIGRIIGKGGTTIKKIMEQTSTKITVSSINELKSLDLERIITVKGTVENMMAAESLISEKLRQSYENDLQAIVPQAVMFPGLLHTALMATSGMSFGSREIYNSSIPYPCMYTNTASQAGGDCQEITYLYIPNNAVGAIIGTKGTHIRNIIKFSGASIKIAPLDETKLYNNRQERKVTVIGPPEAQWKAQYLIFEKMREEGFIVGSDDVRLTVELLVPTSQVGRIIGKGGLNIRELQRLSGSLIRLPDIGCSNEDETIIHITGSFLSVQSAQRRIRTTVSKGIIMPQSRSRSSRTDLISSRYEITSNELLE